MSKTKKTAASSLTAIPDGKVVDFISGRLLNDTPEEYVRQNIAMSLVLEYGYDRSQIAIEHKIRVGSRSKRVDVAIFPADTPHEQEHIAVIVETKKQGTSRESKKDGVEQLKSYMAACLNCEHGMWTNGDDRVCYQKVAKGKKLAFLESIDIPPQGSAAAEAPTRDILRPATGDNLLFAFRRCHNYIAGNQGLQKPEAFWELLKVIFCKIEDERSQSEKLKFYVTPPERSSMSLQARVKSRIKKLFTDVVLKKHPTIFKDNEVIEMSPAVVAYVVSELQQYSLLDSSVDVKGVAYEEIVGSNLRGDRGEFFTPRNACRMAVRILDPQSNERVLDPACGTGGFLITAMNHVLQQIETQHRRRWKRGTPTDAQLLEYHRARHEYLANNMFGLDLNPNLVRAAKMNMVMNNDGSGNLHQANSLEHPHRWDDVVREKVPLGSIDVLFTNPPFGTKIVIDDPRILGQYDLAASWIDEDEEGNPTELQIRKGRDENPVLQSSQPPEILFVDRCLQFLSPGGRMAIVLPNGLLNNPGLAYLRKSILNRAQILAVVDMHRDLFQPHNDTQTSLVFLRKLTDKEREAAAEYDFFMAIADAIGHDKRGNAIYKRNPDGSLMFEEVTLRSVRHNKKGELEEVVVSSLVPIVNDELDDVATAYDQWRRTATSTEQVRKPSDVA